MAAFGILLILGTLGGLVIAVLGHPLFYRAFFPDAKKKSLDH